MSCKQLAVNNGKIGNPFQSVWWKPVVSMQKGMARTLRDTFVGSPFEGMAKTQGCIFDKLEDDVSDVFAEIFNGRQMMAPWLLGDNTEPYVDIIENKNFFKVRAELPGVREKDIDFAIVDGGLQVQGQKYEERTENGENYRHKECHSGFFSRTIALPENAGLKEAKSSFNLGVLTIEIPKKERVEVTKKCKMGVVEKGGKTITSELAVSKIRAGSEKKSVTKKAVKKKSKETEKQSGKKKLA